MFCLLGRYLGIFPSAEKRASEHERGVNERILNACLFLLSLAIKEIKAGSVAKDASQRFVELLCADLSDISQAEGTHRIQNPSIFVYLCVLQQNDRKDANLRQEQSPCLFDMSLQLPLIRWIIREIIELDNRDVCKTLSAPYLKNDNLGSTDSDEPATANIESSPALTARQKKLAAAKKKRAAIMKKMASRRDKFESSNQSVFGEKAQEQKHDTSESYPDKVLSYDCIVCQTSQPNLDIGLIAWVAKSDVMQAVMLPPAPPLQRRGSVLTKDATNDETKQDFISNQHTSGHHIQFCGHCIHLSCMDTHLASLLSKKDSLVAYEGISSVRLEEGEFLCPLCKAMGNMLVPVVSSACKDVVKTSHDVDCHISSDWWVRQRDWENELQQKHEVFSSQMHSLANDFALARGFADKIGWLYTENPHTRDPIIRCERVVEVVSHTIRTLEVGARAFPRYAAPGHSIVLDEVNSRQLEAIQDLVAVATTFVQSPSNRDGFLSKHRSSWQRILSSCRPQQIDDMVAFDVDPFNLLIDCIFTLPRLRLDTTAYEDVQQALLFAFVLCVVQAASHIQSGEITPQHHYLDNIMALSNRSPVTESNSEPSSGCGEQSRANAASATGSSFLKSTIEESQLLPGKVLLLAFFASKV